MVGRGTQLAQWVGMDLRPVLGTSVDLAICPPLCWMQQAVVPHTMTLFFFSNAARTITALTVMRSGRKLRHLDNVGSLTKQNKHKTQPKTNKTKHRQTKASQKARTKVKRCETCGSATLKLSRVLLQEIVPNNIWRHIQNCSVPTTCCASLTHLEAFSKRWLPPAQDWFHPFDR